MELTSSTVLPVKFDGSVEELVVEDEEEFEEDPQDTTQAGMIHNNAPTPAIPPSTFNQQIMTEAMPDLGMSARGWLLVGSGGSREVNFCVHTVYSVIKSKI